MQLVTPGRQHSRASPAKSLTHLNTAAGHFPVAVLTCQDHSANWGLADKRPATGRAGLVLTLVLLH